jgi:hypothetical protein
MNGNAEGNRPNRLDESVGLVIPLEQQDAGHRNQGRSRFNDESREKALMGGRGDGSSPSGELISKHLRVGGHSGGRPRAVQ